MNLVTILGLIAAACTTASLLPQAIKVIKTKEVKNLSLATYLAMTVGLFLWLVYGIILKNIPIILANGISLIFSSAILFLITKHK